MSCLAQTTQGDLDISSGNLLVEQDADTCTAVQLTNPFQMFIGEWFMDSRIGIPYFQKVLVKNPDLVSIAQLFSRVIRSTPNVKDILDTQMDFNSTQRTLLAQFKIQTLTGAIIEGGPGQPFIVTKVANP